MTEETARPQKPWQFQPGQSGNPKGRPPGTRNKVTIAVESLFDAQAAALTQKAIDLAIGGDLTALRICLDRIAPPRKDRPVTFELPQVNSAADASRAARSVLEAVSQGDVTPSEAAEIGKLLDAYVRTLEVTDLEDRLSRLEARSSP